MTEPVRKSVDVAVGVQEAFAAFHERIADWWPLKEYSVFLEDATDVVFEPREGGRVYEISSAGEENDWARVTAWEPSSRLVLAWSPNREPGPETEIEVRFTPDGDGTRVDLEHRGWEILGERADAARGEYDAGWGGLLAVYAQTAV
jgi:uncharacterized protein YndB with AHSA1/START domain